jgi:hypothetical protein
MDQVIERDAAEPCLLRYNGDPRLTLQAICLEFRCQGGGLPATHRGELPPTEIGMRGNTPYDGTRPISYSGIRFSRYCAKLLTGARVRGHPTPRRR